MDEMKILSNPLCGGNWSAGKDAYDVNDCAWLLQLEAKEEQEEEMGFLNVPRAFVIYPSNREAYYALKSVSPELAVKYIEVLLDYGVLRKPIPPNPLLKALLAGTTQTIEKSYREYRKKVEQTEREERKKFMDEYFKKKGIKR